MNKTKNKNRISCHPEGLSVAKSPSGSHVTSVEFVVNDGAKTQPRHALKRSLRPLSYGSSLKMTVSAFFLAAILSVSIISESQAVDCPTGKKVCQTGCIAESLTCGYCGPTCGYTQIGGEVTLYGTGEAVKGFDMWKTVNGVYGRYDDQDNLAPFYDNPITSVKADESSSFTSIGAHAFDGATSLTSVDMPNVTNIGYAAFKGATSLTSMDMPNVTTIDGQAFMDATSLTNISMPNVATIANEAFKGATSLTSIDIPRITSIGSGGFFNAGALEYVGLPTTTDEDGCLLNPEGQRLTTSNRSCITDVWEGSAAFYGTMVPNCGQSNADADACGSCDKYIKSGTGCVTADNCGTGYTANTTTKRCVAFSESDCYASGKVPYQDACVDEYPFAKKHWTPAEAAQYLKDTDNEIIMTFKVNR